VAATDEPLPTRDDFDPTGNCLDADWAWGNFGGLNLSDAHVKFCEDADIYQEDFMFMGGVAFSYYFPVIERYIRESRIVPGSEFEFEVEAMWILAHCINSQFTSPDPRPSPDLRSRIEELVSHVRNNLPQYCEDVDEQRRLDSAWQELQDRMRSFHESGPQSNSHNS
jgi:hypothetical protein